MPCSTTNLARPAITDRFPRSKSVWFEQSRPETLKAAAPRRHRQHDRKSKMCGIVF
ncbi:MAG: hypothetical protein HYZ75_08895 [Elusimicrobia bacterium]|nr:hypothetical protein [Elusimicrobiota bacterium]